MKFSLDYFAIFCNNVIYGEIDFALIQNEVLTDFIEVKLSENIPSRNLKYFKEKHPEVNAIQLVHNTRYEKRDGDIVIFPAGDWLAQLSA